MALGRLFDNGGGKSNPLQKKEVLLREVPAKKNARSRGKRRGQQFTAAGR